MADTDSSKHKAAYAGRKSESTRNPHTASGPTTSKRFRELSQLAPEERVLEQWRAAAGEPISDEAKAQFQVVTSKDTHRLADVRLWCDHHDRKNAKNIRETGTIFLEFFFDGIPADYDGQQDIFTKAFENMIERQLQERRLVEFREKLANRRRGGTEGAMRRKGGGGSMEDGGEGGGSMPDEDDSEWRDYLKKPVPATELSVRSIRAAGCMISFLVCQTSLSVSASEVLGQIAFQEHFPIDGKPQEISKTGKPMPKWVYALMLITAIMLFVTIFAWWQVVRSVVAPGPSIDLAPGPSVVAQMTGLPE